MGDVWYVFVAFLLAGYVILDGFDLGTGVLHLLFARNDEERHAMVKSIGPLWDGNEVWLIAAGGAILLGFPTLLATAFSGFYLPLIIVLWLLVFRALGLELHHQLDNPLWHRFWDVAFGAASLVLAVFFGAALGNVVRGVDMQPDQTFFAPLWTNFDVDPSPGILDWYTVSVAVTATVALSMHGATWQVWWTEGALKERLTKVLNVAWLLVVVLTIAITVETFFVQPQMAANLSDHPEWFVAPGISILGLIGVRWFTSLRREALAFLSSSVYLGGMLISAAAAIFPFVLPARDPALGLTIAQAVGPDYGLKVGLMWWIPGMALVMIYMVFMYRNLHKLSH